MIDKLIISLPTQVDLTNASHLELVSDTVNLLLSEYGSLQSLNDIEDMLIAQQEVKPVFLLLAFKIAKSRLLIKQISEPITVSVVFAVYKENNRILKQGEHPHGEDFLRRKVQQMQSLFQEHSNIQWELIVVDDGCPEHSGRIAQDIVEKDKLSDHVKILFLQDAINQGLPIAETITSTSDSQKGGAIAYGMWHAIHHRQNENHIVVFTDADLSTHLGQLGLLVHPLMEQDKSVAIGSRRETNSVVVKQGTRNDRGKLFIYLWKRLIPNLGEIIDTQCGFKAFKKEILNEIVEGLIEKKFAFDIELLLKAELTQQNSITKVPIAWIDSEAASTTTDLQPYLPMLKSIVKMYQKYFKSNPNSDEFARFIKSLDDEKFTQVLAHIPKEITDREPIDFNTYNDISVRDIEENMRY